MHFLLGTDRLRLIQRISQKLIWKNYFYRLRTGRRKVTIHGVTARDFDAYFASKSETACAKMGCTCPLCVHLRCNSRPLNEKLLQSAGA